MSRGLTSTLQDDEDDAESGEEDEEDEADDDDADWKLKLCNSKLVTSLVLTAVGYGWA